MYDMEKVNGVDPGNQTINSLSNGKNEELTDSEGIANGNGGYLSRLRNDTVFRKRLMHTGFVWWAFVTMGWMVALAGTAFPDIRLIVKKDLETASWLFTGGSLGYMIGAFVGGLVFDRINRLVMLSTVIVLMSASFAAIPWCDNFILMMALNVASSIFTGGLDVGGNSHIASICGAEAGPFMHSIHFGFSVGGILSPLTAEPFFAEKTCKPTDAIGQNSTEFSVSTQFSVLNTTEKCEEVYGETRIHFAYLAAASLAVSAAIPFVVLYCFSGKESRDIVENTKPDTTPQNKQNTFSNDIVAESDLPVLSLKLKVVFVFLLSTLLMCYCAIEGRFSGLLMTFVVEQLDWTKSNGARINTVFWASFAAGRFLGIVITRYLKPSTMLTVYLTALAATFLGFLAASLFTITWLIWVVTALAGLAMSIIFPSIFTWTAESILPVTGTISGIYLLNVSIGNMLLPLLYGYLMDNFTRLWFAYLIIGQCVICIVIYMIILILVRKYITPFKKHEKEQTVLSEKV